MRPSTRIRSPARSAKASSSSAGRGRVGGGEGQLAMVERAERQRQAVTRAAREVVQRPAVAHARGRGGQRGGAARGDDHEIGAAPLGRLAQRRVQRRVVIEDGAPRRRPRARRDPSRSAANTCAPSRARSWASRQPIEPRPTTSAVSPAATRLRFTARRQQASGSVKDAVSSLISAGRRKAACSTLGAGTRTSSAKPPGSRLTRLKWRAHGRAAAPAVVAVKARHVMGDHEPVAGREAPHPRPDLHDLPHHLVAEDGRPGRGRVDLEDVGAAEPAAAHAQQELARARGGHRPLAQLDGARVADRGLHEAARRAPSQQRKAMARRRGVDRVTRRAKTSKRRASMARSSAK